ncbi:MAG: hypothetical protein WCP91_01340 [Candidatus Berkelbacteria bacterium]
MKLTDQDVAEYQKLVKNRHGIDISKEDALEDALSLVNFVRLVHKLPNQDAKNEILG